jgi:hypothetical protein
MLGGVLMLYIIQHFLHFTMANIKKALPPPVKLIQSIPIPWEYIWEPGPEEKKVWKLRQQCKTSAKCWH